MPTRQARLAALGSGLNLPARDWVLTFLRRPVGRV
jgi:hypothetical protein